MLLIANWSVLSMAPSVVTASRILAIVAYVCSLCAALTREKSPDTSKKFSNAKVGVWVAYYALVLTMPAVPVPWYSSLAFLALLAPSADMSSMLFLAYYVFSAAGSLAVHDDLQAMGRAALAIVAARGVLASASAYV